MTDCPLWFENVLQFLSKRMFLVVQPPFVPSFLIHSPLPPDVSMHQPGGKQRQCWYCTCVKISQAITGLLAQQPCNSTVNMIEQDWLSLVHTSDISISNEMNSPLRFAKTKQREFFFVSPFVLLFAYAWTMILCLWRSLCHRLDLIPLFCLLFCPYAYAIVWTRLNITVLFDHVSICCYSLTNRQGLFAYVRTCKTRLNTSPFDLVISSFPDNMHEHGCWFIMMVPTMLFKFICSSSHEQSVPTCMNKPVDNHVQAGQLNYVQAGQLNHVQTCQQAKTSCAFLCVWFRPTKQI